MSEEELRVRAATWQRRHPLQILVAGLLVLVGWPIVLGGPPPGSIVETLPTPLVYIWASMFVIGGGLIVAAAIVRNVLTALYLELTADFPVALTCLTYAGAITAVAPERGFSTWLLYGGIAIAFLIRAWQASKAVRVVRRTLEDHR